MQTSNAIIWNKVISYSVPIFIVVAQYKLVGYVNYGTVFLLLLSLIAFLGSKNKVFTIYKPLLNFVFVLIFALFLSIIRDFNVEFATINWMLQGLAIIFIIMVVSKYSRLQFIYESYAVIGYISIFILFVQAYQIYIIGHSVSPISILPIAESDIRLWQPAPRPSSLFTEPQAYCSFIFPLLLLADKYKNKKLSFLVSISMLLSGSSFGILALFLYLLYRTFFLERVLSNKLIVIFFGLFSLLLLMNLSYFDAAISKIERIDLTYDIRLTKGFILYFDIPILDKIIGLKGEVSDFILSNIHNYPWAYRYMNESSIHLLNYVTTYSSVFLNFGLISGVFFSILIYKLFDNKCSFAKGIAFLIVITSFTATILFNSWFLFYYLLYFSRSEFLGSNAFYHFKFKVSQ
ncbi:hypothetical protein [Photobacterium sp. J15]|uniref:hypothetical protein n=1 Tax=Photobacterium sp. J15 TaxID=265901 RepID=UPI0007E3EC1E|nr:hypothetical protein [Photobacterium sp. J15]